MADDFAPSAPRKRAAPKSTAGSAAKPRKSPRTTFHHGGKAHDRYTDAHHPRQHRRPSCEAKSRFNAAVSEAKAGAAALKAEATERAGGYRQQAGQEGPGS